MSSLIPDIFLTLTLLFFFQIAAKFNFYFIIDARNVFIVCNGLVVLEHIKTSFSYFNSMWYLFSLLVLTLALALAIRMKKDDNSYDSSLRTNLNVNTLIFY